MYLKTVSTWMTPEPITSSLEEGILFAYEKMKLHHIRRLPIVKSDKLVGIITISDVRGIISLDTRSPIERNELLIHKTISSAMTPNPIMIGPGENVGEAARLMMKHKVGGLPVMENGNLVGVISEADLFRLVIVENWCPRTIIGPGLDGDEIILNANSKMEHGSCLSL
jgi:CBS domain-containing protein